MKKWAASTPWNCGHKLELLHAENAYLEGDEDGAAKAYDSAIALAANNSFLHEQGLALERAGVFYFERQKCDIALEFFRKAHDCYTQWGACSKAAHVQVTYL